MAIGILINRFRPEYSENLLPTLDGTLNISSGTNAVISYDTDNYFNSDKSIKITFVEVGTVDRTTFNITDFNTTIKKTGSYILSYRFLKPSDDPEITFFVQMYVNGILTTDTTFQNTLDTALYVGNWVCFSQSFNLNEDDVITFKFQAISDLLGSVLYFDGLKLELDDRNLGTPSIYSEPISENKTIPNDFIFVSSINDLPTAISGVITLEDDKTYYITTTVDLNGSRLVGGSNTTILGASSENSILTSTGLGVGVPLFSSIYTTPIRNLAINDVDTAFSFDGSTNPNDMALDWTGVNFVNVPNVGTIKDASNFIFDKGAFLNSKGLKFDGTIGTIGFGNSLFSGDGLAGNLLEILSTATITRRFRIIYSSVVAFGSTIGINVDASASILVESYILDTVNFSGGSTYLSGVTVSDNKTLFVNCKGIQNTEEISQYYMNANATTTVIASTGVAVKALGTTTSSLVTQKFTNTDNRATYNGALTRFFKVVATLSVESGNNNQIGVYIAKNGTLLSESEVYGTTSGTGRAENIVVQTLVELVENDYIEIFVENSSSATNILVTDLNVTII
jgi:hypothetical protein